MRSISLAKFLPAVALVVLASCGGGGGGDNSLSTTTAGNTPTGNTSTSTGNSNGSAGSPAGGITVNGAPIQLAISPASLAGSFFPFAIQIGGVGANFTVTASNLPAIGGMFALVAADRPVFYNEPFTVTQSAAGTFTGKVPFNTVLSPGTYTGMATLLLCQDSKCAQPYATTGATVPYNITVKPRVLMAATLNGVPATAGPAIAINQPGVSFTGKNGDIIGVSTSTPVTWSDGGSSGANLLSQSTGPNGLSGRLFYGVSQPGLTGSYSITATPLDPNVGPFTLTVYVKQN